jgi:hypothetical protein
VNKSSYCGSAINTTKIRSSQSDTQENVLCPLHKLIHSQNKLSKRPELAYGISLDMKGFKQKWLSHRHSLTHSYSFSYSDTIRFSVTGGHIRSNFSYTPSPKVSKKEEHSKQRELTLEDRTCSSFGSSNSKHLQIQHPLLIHISSQTQHSLVSSNSCSNKSSLILLSNHIS